MVLWLTVLLLTEYAAAACRCRVADAVAGCDRLCYYCCCVDRCAAAVADFAAVASVANYAASAAVAGCAGAEAGCVKML